MIIHAPAVSTASSSYTQGPEIRDPLYKDKENILPQQFKAYAPSQQEEIIKWFLHTFTWQPYSPKNRRKWKSQSLSRQSRAL